MMNKEDGKMVGQVFMRRFYHRLGANGPEKILEAVFTDYDGTVLQYGPDGKLEQNLRCSVMDAISHAARYWSDRIEIA